MKLLTLLLLIVLICHFREANGQDGSGNGGKHINFSTCIFPRFVTHGMSCLVYVLRALIKTTSDNCDSKTSRLEQLDCSLLVRAILKSLYSTVSVRAVLDPNYVLANSNYCQVNWIHYSPARLVI